MTSKNDIKINGELIKAHLFQIKIMPLVDLLQNERLLDK